MSHVIVYKDGGYFGAFENTAVQRKIGDVLPTETRRPIPATWAELHQYIPCGNSADSAWLNEFSLRVLTGSCQCRNHWVDYLANNPPDFSSPDAWFIWTIAAHNSVNQRLGKRVYTVEEGRAIWIFNRNSR